MDIIACRPAIQVQLRNQGKDKILNTYICLNFEAPGITHCNSKPTNQLRVSEYLMNIYSNLQLFGFVNSCCLLNKPVYLVWYSTTLHMQMKTFFQFRYASWAAQHMQNDVLCSLGSCTKGHSICVHLSVHWQTIVHQNVTPSQFGLEMLSTSLSIKCWLHLTEVW